jgi:hypothetical protein
VKKTINLPDIPEQDQTPLVKSLLGIIEQLAERVQQQDEEIAQLKDDVNILKGEKKRPIFRGSKLDKKTDSAKKNKSTKRAGSSMKKKTQKLMVHEERIIKPDEKIPDGSRFKGYRDFVAQDLHISVHTTRYRLENWITPQKKSLIGQHCHSTHTLKLTKSLAKIKLNT